jgi:ribose 1,5-bisphosphokinase
MKTGRLFYLMGASGTGKDSLLQYLKNRLDESHRVKLPQRHITRPADAGGETHIALTPEAFQRQAERGDFALHWQSHGFHYGIGREIDGWLAEGFHVVINGSRRYLETAQALYPSLHPILIRVSHDALLQRLVARGRENREEIESRLQRAEALDGQMICSGFTLLRNDGPLSEAGEALCKLVLSEPVGKAETTVVKPRSD